MGITVSRMDSLNLNLGLPDNLPPKKGSTGNINSVSSLSNSDSVNFSSLPKNRFEGNPDIQKILEGKKSFSSGSKGNGVKIVQSALSDMGFYIGSSADGRYGNQTIVAVMNFQDSRNLPKTGIVDKITMEELVKISPPAELKLWDKSVKISDGVVPSNQLEKGKKARVVIDLSEHRLFFFNKDNTLNKIYSIASGKDGHEDGRGGKTSPGLKKVTGKNNDPGKRASELWPESKGKAFGTKLIDLSWYEPASGKTRASGEELHGTFTDNSIGTDASHGCMRLLNSDVEEIFGQVRVGDLVKVQQ